MLTEINEREHLVQALHWRYATKAFDASRQIPDEDWHVLKESLRLAPSSYGFQPWKFLVIQDPHLRERLRPATRGQAQVTDCSRFVVLTTLKKLGPQDIERNLLRLAEVRSMPAEALDRFRQAAIGDLVEGPRAKTIGSWAQRQAYIAMGFLLLAASQLGVDSCPIEGMDALTYDNILGLESGPWATVACVALGYRSKDDKYQGLPKVRFKEADVFESR